MAFIFSLRLVRGAGGASGGWRLDIELAAWALALALASVTGVRSLPFEDADLRAHMARRDAAAALSTSVAWGGEARLWQVIVGARFVACVRCRARFHQMKDTCLGEVPNGWARGTGHGARGTGAAGQLLAQAWRAPPPPTPPTPTLRYGARYGARHRPLRRPR